MVECELNLLLTAYRYLSGFNRYMVECEYDGYSYMDANGRVLIDTWWNVNCVTRSSNLYRRLGFNRYMVECELRYAKALSILFLF